LLHHVGHVVLALFEGLEFQRFVDRVDHGEGVLDAELEMFGVTHAEVGSRLLAIWGLPAAISDAVQFHHDPGSGPEACRYVASVVHVADSLAQGPGACSSLDLPSLERAGCAPLVAGWRAIAARPA
jgi:HD-like signal output (HDOD) protein